VKSKTDSSLITKTALLGTKMTVESGHAFSLCPKDVKTLTMKSLTIGCCVRRYRAAAEP
jgi:hypothetical protein